MKIYLFETVVRNSGLVGRTRMTEERIAKQFPRVLGLEIDEKIELTEEEAGYEDYQKFVTSVMRLS